MQYISRTLYTGDPHTCSLNTVGVEPVSTEVITNHRKFSNDEYVICSSNSVDCSSFAEPARPPIFRPENADHKLYTTRLSIALGVTPSRAVGPSVAHEPSRAIAPSRAIKPASVCLLPPLQSGHAPDSSVEHLTTHIEFISVPTTSTRRQVRHPLAFINGLQTPHW